MHKDSTQPLFIGIDLGSSFLKLSIMTLSQHLLESLTLPSSQMPIKSRHYGWAQQDPQMWWNYVQQGLHYVFNHELYSNSCFAGIGISYQMHGLVMVDQKGTSVEDSIIWCDGRTAKLGAHLYTVFQREGVLKEIINHPSNFTLSKLVWIKQNRPQIYSEIHKIMLPGDFIAMKLSGKIQTTRQGLSEGTFWNYSKDQVSLNALKICEIDPLILPELVQNFAYQCQTSQQLNNRFNLKSSIPIYYRSGDQPNNAFSLNVLQPGQVAATGGTSGVIYAISSQTQSKQILKYNSFLHVNHSKDHPRIGKLLCINGCGIIYQWIRKNFFDNLTYQEMNELAKNHQSEGILVIPFGNGPERMLQNKDVKCNIFNINFNIHTRGHIIRAALEGVAFSFVYGANLMKDSQIRIDKMKAGKGNLFQSEVFCQILSSILNVQIQIYETNGAEGAAKASILGYLRAINKQGSQKFEIKVNKLKTFQPNIPKRQEYIKSYQRWLKKLKQLQGQNSD